MTDVLELDQITETVPDNAPESDFADPPRGLYVGDAKHAALAVAAVTTGFRGNTAKAKSEPGVKAKIAAAIRKFYSGAEQKYYLSWLETGKKPDEKPAAEIKVSEIRLSTPDFSFKGTFPEVPLAPGVDYDALIAIPCPACHGDGCERCSETGSVPDPKPLFVVRPLGKLNAISDNGLKYDQELLDEIREQVITKKPAGRQGHVSEEASSYAFPDDVSIWVGAIQEGDTLFGKAFIYRNKPFHEMVIRRKAAGSTLSNSIWGKGRFGKNDDGTLNLRGLDLETIDFAPVERAALGDDLDGTIVTTSEMGGSMAGEHSDEAQDLELIRKEIAKMMPSKLHEYTTPEQRAHIAESCLREMEPSAVYGMLPDGHRKHISECYTKEFGQHMPTAEMTTLEGRIAEMQKAADDQKQSIAEMQATIAEYRQKDYERTLDAAAAAHFATWNVQQEASRKMVESAKGVFKMLLVAEMATIEGGAKIENIAAADAAAWPKYEPQANALKMTLSGGNVITGLVSEAQRPQVAGYDPKTGRYDESVAKAERAKVGF